jgi:hypothetical protein
MKNTLLAVLLIVVCYECTQAQVNPQRPSGFIKFQGTHPTKFVGKGASTKNTTTDGAVTTNKLANDILISNIMADGTVTTDKLANDILSSMRAGNKVLNANASATDRLTGSVLLCGAVVNNQQLYTRYMQQPMAPWQYASNFKRTGWLQYKVD